MLQRRFAGRVRVLGEGRALELQELVDSDGDRRYRLQTRATDGKPLTLDTASGDPSSLRGLGAFVADRAHVPFTDSVPTEAQRRQRRRDELQTLGQQLLESGPLGRWAARWI